ncbi:CapA family protein [Actinoplanes sp. NPDC023714]|uniref:CapA family protein n=1 Tax=Actinoplanes sp. NPDC023714 TaxID=3154322 RepID=UPI0033C9E1EC
MRRAAEAAAAAGLCGVVLHRVVEAHYLQAQWSIGVPVPMLWWLVGVLAGLAGVPLMLTALGGRAAAVLTVSWPRLLLTWTLPLLTAHALWLAATIAVVDRVNPGFAGITATGLDPLLPAPQLSLLYALALLPVVGKASLRLPGPAVIAALCLLVPLHPTAAVLLFLMAGLRLTRAVGRCVPRPRRRSRSTIVPTYLILIPLLAVLDAVLLPRISTAGTGTQLVAAAAGPVAVTAVVIAAGALAAALARRVRWPLIAVTTLLAVTGCTAAGEPAASPEITLTFAGDVHFQGRADLLLDAPSTAFGTAAPELARGDLTFVNLETAITGRRGPAEPKRYLFRAREAAAPALRSAGVDVVSLANNHSMDFGRPGLADTIAAADRHGLGVVGAGRDAGEAYAPWRRTVHGVRIAVLAFSQVDDLAESWAAQDGRPGMAMAFEGDRALAAVRDARATSDLVVVLPHWGTEGDRCADGRQRDFAAALVDAGADVIVGAHAHVLQGAGRSGDAYVAYGLGNFLWYSSGLFVPHSARAGILHLTVRHRTVVREDFVPTVVSASGQPAVVTGWQATLARHTFAGLRSCAGLGAVR